MNASKNAPSKNYLNFAVLGDAKWNTLNESFKQIEISREAIAQAEENLRIQREYYNAGTATLSNMLEAETLRQQVAEKMKTDAELSTSALFYVLLLLDECLKQLFRVIACGKSRFDNRAVFESRELLQVECCKFMVSRIAEIKFHIPVIASLRTTILLQNCIEFGRGGFQNCFCLLTFCGGKFQGGPYDGRICRGVSDFSFEAEKGFFSFDIDLIEEGCCHLHFGNVFHVLSLC